MAERTITHAPGRGGGNCGRGRPLVDPRPREPIRSQSDRTVRSALAVGVQTRQAAQHDAGRADGAVEVDA
jgi:hypothetical protein